MAMKDFLIAFAEKAPNYTRIVFSEFNKLRYFDNNHITYASCPLEIASNNYWQTAISIYNLTPQEAEFIVLSADRPKTEGQLLFQKVLKKLDS